MALRKFKPTTPARRWGSVTDFKELSKAKPEKRLLTPLKRTAGRNLTGRITSRHRGGGHKRMYRIIDFKRNKRDIPAKVISIQYDPNRSARIALLEYQDGERRYIISPHQLKVGDEVISGPNAEIKTGNYIPLRNIPPGTLIHSIELAKGGGGKVVRSAGSSAQIMAKEGKYAHVKMPSGEVRLINLDCYAAIGQVSNVEHGVVILGKAGRSRWLGRRPQSRGVVMNPVDHPLGGGEGKSSGGRHPVTPWGKITKGLKTRKKKKYSNRFIITRRTEKVL